MGEREEPEDGNRGTSVRALKFTPTKDADVSLITSSVRKKRRDPSAAISSPPAKARRKLPVEDQPVEELASPELRMRKVDADETVTTTADKPKGDRSHAAAEPAADAVQSTGLPADVPAPPLPQGKCHSSQPQVEQDTPEQGKSKGVLQTIFSPVFHLFHQGDSPEGDASGAKHSTPERQDQNRAGSSRRVSRRGKSRSKSPEEPKAARAGDCERVAARAEEARPDELSKPGATPGMPAVSEGASSTDGDSQTCLGARPLLTLTDSRFPEEESDGQSEAEGGEEVHMAGADVDDEDLLEFDPYSFIKSLPPLEQCIPVGRRSLLPKQTRQCKRKTLVLDLDETLVHSSLEATAAPDFCFDVSFNNRKHSVHVRRRPFLAPFLERCADLFEVVIFTASQKLYAEQLLNILDPERKFIRHRIFRDACLVVEGNYLKDLTVLGRDLAHTVIVDNSPQAFGFQLANGVPIESWYDDESDQELMRLLPFLESLVEVPDVRPVIVNAFKLHKLVAQAPRY